MNSEIWWPCPDLLSDFGVIVEIKDSVIEPLKHDASCTNYVISTLVNIVSCMFCCYVFICWICSFNIPSLLLSDMKVHVWCSSIYSVQSEKLQEEIYSKNSFIKAVLFSMVLYVAYELLRNLNLYNWYMNNVSVKHQLLYKSKLKT